MAIDLNNGYNELSEHIGHDIVCVFYGPGTDIQNVAIECKDCGAVLLDFDRPPKEESDTGDEDYWAERISAVGADVVEQLTRLYAINGGDEAAVGEQMYEIDKAARRNYHEHEEAEGG